MPGREVRGAYIAWEERGRGPAILLIHGGLFDPMTGTRFWIAPGVADDIASAGLHVLIPDRRFSPGRTNADIDRHTWDREADDMAAILDAAAVERAHIVAGSNGCSVGAMLALLHPERVASLTLCWPAAPTTAALSASFELSAVAVERDGTAAYLDRLRRDGVPRPGEGRPGFPFGFALLHDRRTASSFLALDAPAASAIFRETAAALLPGDPIRGLTLGDAARIGAGSFPVRIMPAEPEDPYHLRAIAEALRAAIPGATMTRGYPITPSRFFADVRAAFAREIVTLIGEVPATTLPPHQ